MTRNDETWIFVVDNGRGRLFQGSKTERGRPHLEQRAAIDNNWEQHEHGRPSPRKGKGGRSYASRGHEDEERLNRFAKSVAQWLDQQTAQHGIDRVKLFAPPRFLGALRQACSPQLAARIDEHEGDLGYMDAGDLAKHRAVAALVAGNNNRNKG